MDKVENTKSNETIVRRTLAGIFSSVIAISVALVMFLVYNPRQNALKALSSVCMDIVCIIILLILISSFVFDNYVSTKTSKMFAGLLEATIWAIFLDFLNWALDGSLQFGHLTFWFTLGSLCMGAVLAGLFSLYMYCYMEEIHKLKRMRKTAIVCAVLNLFSFGLTFILAITGTAFRFVDGHYETGVLYDAVTIIPILTVLYLSGYIIRFVRIVGVHDAFAVGGYVFFMVAGALIEAAYTIGTTYVAVAIADIFIFVMLQNEIIAKEKRNVQKWMKRSNTDGLTSFLNRNAYETEIKNLSSGSIEDDFVYVSADVNSLKVVNDSLGHSAGDELIVGAAECLQKSFGAYGSLYRIGGDEFVALIHASEEQLEKIQKTLEESTEKWKGKQVDSIAISCGYVTRREAMDMSVRQIAILADRRMYEAKNEYYKRKGIDRRMNKEM